MAIRVAILTDNRQRSAAMECEHGLSVYVGVGDYHMLMDTGQTGKCVRNAERMGIDLSQTNAIMISHGHYDHAGGLGAAIEAAPEASIVVHPMATRPKYSVSTVMTKPNGFPHPELLKSDKTIYVRDRAEIAPGITIFALPTPAPANDALRIDGSNGLIPDSFEDELFALIRHEGQTLLYGGCTHHGIKQVLEYVAHEFGVERLDMFVGGLHLKGRTQDTIDLAAEEAKRHHVGEWVINHCSGEDAINTWRDRFGTHPEKGFAGTQFEV